MYRQGEALNLDKEDIVCSYLTSSTGIQRACNVVQDLQGIGERGKEQARKIRDFFTALALCHTVIPERFEDTDEVRTCKGRLPR